MNIIITGASKGIGFAIAEIFASNGHQVYLNSKTAADLEKAAKQLKTTFPNTVIEFMAADLSKEEEVQAFAKWCLSKTCPDILVNNAGITRDNLLLRMKADEWNAVLETNLTAVFKLTQLCLKPMLKAQTGRIINISSIESK